MASLGRRDLRRVRVREYHRSTRSSIRNHNSRDCDRFRMGDCRFGWFAVVRIRFPGYKLASGEDCERPSDYPPSTTPGLWCAARMASDCSDYSSTGLGEVASNSVLVDYRSGGGILCHLDAECLSEMSTLFLPNPTTAVFCLVGPV